MTGSTPRNPHSIIELEVAYHFLAAIGGFYMTAIQSGGLPSPQERWQILVDSSMADLGRVHDVWEHFLNIIKAGFKPPHLKDWVQREPRLMPRINRLQNRMNTWTSLKRWLWVIDGLEQAWQNYLTDLSREGLDREKSLYQLITYSQRRQQVVQKLQAENLQYRKKIDEEFEEPIAI